MRLPSPTCPESYRTDQSAGFRSEAEGENPFRLLRQCEGQITSDLARCRNVGLRSSAYLVSLPAPSTLVHKLAHLRVIGLEVREPG